MLRRNKDFRLTWAPGCLTIFRVGEGVLAQARDASTRNEAMPAATSGAIDCDLHPAIPGCMALLPYLDEHWHEEVVSRGLDDLDLALWPSQLCL